MSKQRRTFSAELKRKAAALVLDQGYSHIETCRSLDVVDSALRRWLKQLQQERSGTTPHVLACIGLSFPRWGLSIGWPAVAGFLP